MKPKWLISLADFTHTCFLNHSWDYVDCLTGITEEGNFLDFFEKFKKFDIPFAYVRGETNQETYTQVSLDQQLIGQIKQSVREYLLQKSHDHVVAIGVCLGSLNFLNLQMYHNFKNAEDFTVKAPLNKNQVIIVLSIVYSLDYFDQTVMSR